MAIVRTEDRKGYVTFQNRVYMAGILFKINSQYPFDQVAWVEVGCGCNGTKVSQVKHYRVCANGNAPLIDAKHLVETNVAIPVESQDFDVARRDQHLNPGTDFRDIVVNNNPADIWHNASEVQPKDRFKHPNTDRNQ